MYLELSTEDKKAENWKFWNVASDGILIFVGFYLLISCFIPTYRP